MLDARKARRDILAGLVFIAFGAAFALVSTTYEVGTPLRMGPGYFPLVLGGILVLLGMLIIGKGFIAGEGGEIGRPPWRALALLVVAIIFFGITVRGLGLVPSLFVTVVLAAMAARGIGARYVVLVAVGLTVLCVVIFVYALQLRLSLIGPWIPA